MDILNNIKADIENLKEFNSLMCKRTELIKDYPDSQEKISALQLILQVSDNISILSKLYLESLERYETFAQSYIDDQLKAKEILIQMNKITTRINEF